MKRNSHMTLGITSNIFTKKPGVEILEINKIELNMAHLTTYYDMSVSNVQSMPGTKISFYAPHIGLRNRSLRHGELGR
jgi:hypothetical protein